MNRPIEFNNYPFRFLLYLEWLLLSVAIFTEVIPSPLQRFAPDFPQLIIGIQIIFGLMGLRLPNGKLINKLIYTAIEIFLISIAGFFGGRTARLFPFLYLILVTRSCLIFELPGRLIITGLSLWLFLITLSHRVHHLGFSRSAQEKFRFFPLNLTFLFSLTLIFILLLMNTLITERKIRENLAIANDKLRRYALQIESQATLEERNRIAREIHDSLGHSLTALNLHLETGVKLLQSNPTKATTFLISAKELGSKALQDVRESVSTMRYHPLEKKSLEPAISILLEDFQRGSGILPFFSIFLDYPLPPEVNTAVYRIIQESLTNISKYAQASEIKISITTKADRLELRIKDNGKGFDIKENTTGFGLQSMRDRTLTLGGEIEIHSAHNAGCQIIVNIPLGR